MTSKRILIVSYPGDLHARSLAYAINAKGHTAVELFCGDFPTRLNVSVRAFKNGVQSASITDSVDRSVCISDSFDTIYMRRRHEPWLPPTLHPGDREVARRQCERTLQDCFVALDRPGVFWVNHFERESTSLLKVFQLRQAIAADLTIPDTLVSNDPDEIKTFINTYAKNSAIHKLVQHATWKREDTQEILACYTSPISCNDLPNDAILRLCPGIFQPLIPKWGFRRS